MKIEYRGVKETFYLMVHLWCSYAFRTKRITGKTILAIYTYIICNSDVRTVMVVQLRCKWLKFLQRYWILQTVH